MFTPYFRSKTTNQTRPQRPRRQLACSSKLKGSSTFTWAGHCTTWRSRSKTSPDLLRGERGNSRGFFDGFKPEDNMVILIAGENDQHNGMGHPISRQTSQAWRPWFVEALGWCSSICRTLLNILHPRMPVISKCHPIPIVPSQPIGSKVQAPENRSFCSCLLFTIQI